jgi:hypothetical protein
MNIKVYRGDGPWSSNDFIAYDEDTYDGAEDSHPSCRCIGYGRTENEAIAALQEELAFHNDA